MLEALFGITAPAPRKEPKKSAPAAAVQVQILEARKAHNFSIQLRALGLIKQEVIEALLEGFSSFLPLLLKNDYASLCIPVLY